MICAGRTSRFAVGIAAALVFVCAFAAAASAAVTPGWECVPTTAGQAVVSGGTGSAPSCGAGATAVLAPTYVPSGVGGKPTVQFAAVNLQIVSGSGSTSGAVNGEGNVVIGYAENANGYSRAGSHDLVVGSNNGWKSYGEIVGGNRNQALGIYATVFGNSNTASGSSSFAAGEINTASGGSASVSGGGHNTAKATDSSITGGIFNTAAGNFDSIAGGCSNLAGPGTVSIDGICYDTSGRPNGFAAVGGGAGNHALATASSVSGGLQNTADGRESSVGGGSANDAAGDSASIVGGDNNHAFSSASTISGGEMNSISPGAGGASISGGCDNLAGPGLVSDVACPNAGPDEWIGGGYANNVTDPFSSIAGGCKNVTGTAPLGSSNCDRFNGSGGEEAILGGTQNRASARADSVSGGALNTASGGHASVSGGESNTASATGASILGGSSNTASATDASVLGGSSNTASWNCASIPVIPNDPGC